MSSRKGKKILIVCTSSRQYSPYIEFYVSICLDNNLDFILVTKEKEGYISDSPYHKPFILTNDMLAKHSIIRTLIWHKYIRQIIKKEGCNKLIVLTTRTAVILSPVLFISKCKYIFDIRDYTNEHKKWWRILEKIIIEKAEMTVVSSAGFLYWIPCHKNIRITHNMPSSFSLKPNARLKTSDLCIVKIGYVGLVDYYEQNKNLLIKLSKCKRYKFKYSGTVTERCKLKEFVENNNFTQVQFTGSFSNTEKPELYNDVDMINAIYGNDSLIVTTALPNKLYDALIYKIPIIASKGTYLGKIVEANHIGIAVDVVNDDVQALMDNYWDNFVYDEFEKNCTRFLNDVTVEMIKTKEEIIGFCNS